MAEVRWENTAPGSLDRAEIRQAVPLAHEAVRAVRDDPTSYLPLQNQIAPDGPSFVPPSSEPKAPPSEVELREVLTECVASRDFAVANLQRATASAARAVQYREQCERHLLTFAGVDDAITAHTVAALRDNGRTELPDELRQRLAARARARDDVAASIRAEGVLGAALADAKEEAEAATKSASLAAAEVITLTAVALAQQVLDLEVEAQRKRELLYGFDRIVTGAGVRTPQLVQRVYGDTNRFLRPIESEPWVALRQKLLDEPQAPLALESAQ